PQLLAGDTVEAKLDVVSGAPRYLPWRWTTALHVAAVLTRPVRRKGTSEHEPFSREFGGNPRGLHCERRRDALRDHRGGLQIRGDHACQGPPWAGHSVHGGEPRPHRRDDPGNNSRTPFARPAGDRRQAGEQLAIGAAQVQYRRGPLRSPTLACAKL